MTAPAPAAPDLRTSIRSMFKEILAEEIQSGAKDLQGFKHNASTSYSGPYMHGPDGMLRYPGVDPDVFSTFLGHLGGLVGMLQSRGSLYMNPQYEIITGMRAGTGDERDGLCDEAPIGGSLKSGIVTLPFGMYARQTRTIVLSRMGQRNDRAEPLDLNWVNMPDASGPFGTGINPTQDVLVNEISNVMFERAVEFYRLLARQVWRGNPANVSAGGGYREFAGLNLLITSAWTDAYTGAVLPSTAPNVKDFALKRIDQFGDELVNYVTYTARSLVDLAERTNITPVRWVIAMRPKLFYELTKVWPCSYFTALCSFDGTDARRQNIDLGDQIEMRDDMRRRRFLLIDGQEWPVVLDDAMDEYSNTTKTGVVSGCFSSDIFFIPMSAAGRLVTYLEHFQYQNPSVNAAIQNMALARVLPGGAFLETPAQIRGCLSWQAEIQPRLVMRTPWLAARIKNVQYCPLESPREPFPDDPYHVNGGVSERSGPSLWNAWANV